MYTLYKHKMYHVHVNFVYLNYKFGNVIVTENLLIWKINSHRCICNYSIILTRNYKSFNVKMLF